MAATSTNPKKINKGDFEKSMNEKREKMARGKDKDSKSLSALSNVISVNTLYPTTDGGLKKSSFYDVTFDQLRSFSISYPIARACINRRISQITQLAWTVAPVKFIVDPDEKERVMKKAERVKKLLKFPTGTREMTFRGWITKLCEDILTIDAIAIERRKTYGGDTVGWFPFDASTIELKIYPDGSRPVPPDIAYLLKISGQVVSEMTSDDMFYGQLHPRTTTPYGLSPLESLVLTTTTALKLQGYNLGYLTEGNIPEGFVELPKDIVNSPEQLTEWQRAWDAIFSGDPRYQRKLKFLPEGMKYHEVRKQSDMEFERFEKWLLLNTCAVFAVPPEDIGFTFDANKAVAETQWEIGKERGLLPLCNFVKEVLDEIIHEDMGLDDLEFVWLNLNPTNKIEEAKTFQILVNSGAVSVDEWRMGEGLDPIGVPQYIMTPIGPIFTKDLVRQSEEGLEPTLPYAQPAAPGGKSPTTGAPQDAKPPGSGQKTTNPETIRAQARDKSVTIDELKKWKKAAKNDLRIGKGYRTFYTDIIDTRTQGLVKMGLAKAVSKEDIDKIFEPFMDEDTESVQRARKLYADISEIISR